MAVSSTEKPYQQLNEDVFHLVSDWYHYAIRELVSTEDFKKEDRWIARRLGISTTEVRGAWERLLRLGLIEKKRDKWVAVQSVTTTQDIPSLAIRKFHQQTISKSLASVDETPVGLRDLSSTTMATDLAKVKLAKVAIKKFRRKMAAAMERGRKSEVYQLNIQLIPLTTQEITDASCN